MIMKKETLEKRIVNLIKKYAPRGTTFEWSRTTTCFGDCSYEYNRSTKRYSNLEKLIEKDAARAKKNKHREEHSEGQKEEKQEEIDLPKKKD